jgi:hypothetical protein
MKMFGQSFDEALKAIQESLRLEEFHQSTRGCCVIHYNDIVETPRKAIEKIGSYLGLDVPGPIVDEVSHRTSLQRMKEVSDQLDKRPSTSMVESGGLLYDRETLLHKSHIRDGRTGYGSDLLSAEQQNRIREMLAEFPGSSDS